MNRIFYPAFFLLLTLASISAQTLVLESNLNNDLPGAQYKFSFIHLTDTHIGEGIDDYGSPGWANDTMPEGDIGYAAERLRKAVNWINENAESKNIRFVLITGDLTDSAEKSEFEKAREILNSLNIPYIPQIGNHDVVGYIAGGRDTRATGDSVANEIFKDAFERFKDFADRWDDGRRFTRVYSPYSEQEQFLQNFMFEYQGFGFIFMDMNPRFRQRPDTDPGPKPRLNDYPGGSFEWLMESLERFENKGTHNIFLMSHQPPHKDPIALFNGLPFDEYDKVTKSLLPYRNHLAYWLAGHVHRNRDYNVATINGTQFVIKARETTANKEFENAAFRLVNVYEAPKVTSLIDQNLQNAIQVYPNPAKDEITLSMPSSPEQYQISITDIQGKETGLKLDLPKGVSSTSLIISGWLPGHYHIRIENGNNLAIKQIVKL
jgi:DNA repair exonuclease SbcCD nuclease subunit